MVIGRLGEIVRARLQGNIREGPKGKPTKKVMAKAAFIYI